MKGKPAIHLSNTVNKITLLSPITRILLATISIIVAFVLVGRYADMQIHDYGMGVIDTNASSNLESGIPGIERALVRWDSNHYVQLSERGYTNQQTAFFPIYPILVSSVSSLAGISIQASLFAVSWLFTFLSGVALYYWSLFEIKKRKLKKSPWTPLFLLAIFPTSFFFVAGYTESLFFFLTVSSIYAYRTKRYLLAGSLVALSTATRVQGGALAFFFLLDYLSKKDWSSWKKLIPVLMSPLGLGAYMLFLASTFGNPFEFMAAQEHWGRMSGDVLGNLISSFTPVYLWYLPVLSIGLWAIYKYLGWTWFVYSLIFILIPISSGRLDSLNRYMVALPPLFLALSLLLDRTPDWMRQLYITSCIFLLSWNIIFFVNNYWVG